MGREYKIHCVPVTGSGWQNLLQRLPPPFQPPQMQEIYSFCVDADGYYFLDHLVDRAVAASALQMFLDAALSKSDSITLSEP